MALGTVTSDPSGLDVLKGIFAARHFYFSHLDKVSSVYKFCRLYKNQSVGASV